MPRLLSALQFLRAAGRRLRGAGLGALLAGLLLPGLAAAAPEVPPDVIRFGFPGAGVGSPPRMSLSWLAFVQEQKVIEQEFAREGLRVEWVFFKGAGPAVNEALTNRQLDFTALGDLPALVGRSVGVDTRLLAVLSSRGDYYVAARRGSGIRSVADLRGRRIGFHKGTATQLGVNRVLARAGLAEKDLKVINLDPAAQLAAFQAGDIDALIGPFALLRLQELGLADIVADTRNDPTVAAQTYILARSDFAQKHPQTTQRVLKALLRSAAWAADEAHRDAVLGQWASVSALPLPLFQSIYRGRPLAEVGSPRIDAFVRARLQQSVADALRFRLIRRGFEPSAWVDAAPLEAAIRELKLESVWPLFDADGRPLPTTSPTAALR